MPDTKKILFVLLVISMIIMINQEKKEAFLSDSLSFLQGKCSDVIGLYPNAKIWQRTTVIAGCTLYCLDSVAGTCEEVSPECNYDILVQSCGGSCTCTSWQEGGCGTNGCTPNSKSRTRTCTPGGCDVDLECYTDASCTQSCSNPTADPGKYTCSNGKIWHCDPTNPAATLGWVHYQDCASLVCQTTGIVQDSYIGLCKSEITYSDFLSYKSSYLSGGSFTSFISSANNWIGG